MNVAELNSQDLLQVVIRDRTGEVFSGTVFSVSSSNSVGPFDVMGLHANMVTTIQEKILLQKTPGQFETIMLQSGLLRVHQNQVEVFLGL